MERTAKRRLEREQERERLREDGRNRRLERERERRLAREEARERRIDGDGGGAPRGEPDSPAPHAVPPHATLVGMPKAPPGTPLGTPETGPADGPDDPARGEALAAVGRLEDEAALREVARAAKARLAELGMSDVVETRLVGAGRLQLEYRRGSAAGSQPGRRRGPYWTYKYVEDGRSRTLYLGKTDEPEALLEEKLRQPQRP